MRGWPEPGAGQNDQHPTLRLNLYAGRRWFRATRVYTADVLGPVDRGDDRQMGAGSRMIVTENKVVLSSEKAGMCQILRQLWTRLATRVCRCWRSHPLDSPLFRRPCSCKGARGAKQAIDGDVVLDFPAQAEQLSPLEGVDCIHGTLEIRGDPSVDVCDEQRCDESLVPESVVDEFLAGIDVHGELTSCGHSEDWSAECP